MSSRLRPRSHFRLPSPLLIIDARFFLEDEETSCHLLQPPHVRLGTWGLRSGSNKPTLRPTSNRIVPTVACPPNKLMASPRETSRVRVFLSHPVLGLYMGCLSLLVAGLGQAGHLSDTAQVLPRPGDSAMASGPCRLLHKLLAQPLCSGRWMPAACRRQPCKLLAWRKAHP